MRPVHRIRRGSAQCTGTSHASTFGSPRHARRSRSAWTDWPPGMSSDAATIATRSLRMVRTLDRLRGRDSRDRRLPRGAVDELPEPELEHHEAPEPVAMIGRAVAVLAPERSDGV